MPNSLQKKLNELKNPQTPLADLGRLEKVYGISPAYLQRAAFIAVLSFLFFIAMMTAFSLRRNIGYFLLATAFLLVQLLTLFGWLMQRRAEFKIYEKGFAYKNQTWSWDEIETIDAKMESRLPGAAKVNYEITKINGEKILLTESVRGVEEIIRRLEMEIGKRKTGN
jgi:hypothetical protein